MGYTLAEKRPVLEVFALRFQNLQLSSSRFVYFEEDDVGKRFSKFHFRLIKNNPAHLG